MQLYKNNARALLSRILSMLNLDWLQHARSVHGVYEKIVSGYKELTGCEKKCCHRIVLVTYPALHQVMVAH